LGEREVGDWGGRGVGLVSGEELRSILARDGMKRRELGRGQCENEVQRAGGTGAFGFVFKGQDSSYVTTFFFSHVTESELVREMRR
jgi:hypothetical protein